MSIAKAGFIETPVPKTATKKVLLREVDRLGTPTLLWFIAKRHKTGLLVTGNLTLATLYFFPFVPDMLLSALQSL